MLFNKSKNKRTDLFEVISFATKRLSMLNSDKHFRTPKADYCTQYFQNSLLSLTILYKNILN